ncbi:MAG: transposase [Gammaproteobacteria bacterium]
MERSAESEQTERWIAAKRGFLFPVRAFSKVFRGKYLDALSQAFERGELRFAGHAKIRN